MSEDEQLDFPLQVTAPQWSQRAEQAANDDVHEREQQSDASSAGTKSAMLAEKLLLTAGVAISAPFRRAPNSMRHYSAAPRSYGGGFLAVWSRK
jgi:hypothetical protein